jgi:hypothetical protein
MDDSLCSTSMHIDIMALYGFDFMGQNISAAERPTTLMDFIEICVVAVQYEIDGLLSSALKAASEALTHCLSHENEDEGNRALDEFLNSEPSDWHWILTDSRYTPLMFKILRDHLYKI